MRKPGETDSDYAYRALGEYLSDYGKFMLNEGCSKCEMPDHSECVITPKCYLQLCVMAEGDEHGGLTWKVFDAKLRRFFLCK